MLCKNRHYDDEIYIKIAIIMAIFCYFGERVCGQMIKY